MTDTNDNEYSIVRIETDKMNGNPAFRNSRGHIVGTYAGYISTNTKRLALQTEFHESVNNAYIVNELNGWHTGQKIVHTGHPYGTGDIYRNTKYVMVSVEYLPTFYQDILDGKVHA